MGLGLGNSRQKYMYLPEPQNDFIFAIVCEELGLIGAILVILLFVLLVYRGFVIANRAPNKFASMLVVGITIQIGIQALFNIAVVTNAFPNTGISLPFFSYGGTALMMQLFEMGVILNHFPAHPCGQGTAGSGKEAEKTTVGCGRCRHYHVETAPLSAGLEERKEIGLCGIFW